MPVSSTLPQVQEDKLLQADNMIFEPATILIADDVEMNRQLVKSFLDDTNLRMVEAEDGEQAVSAAEAAVPDIILMDISMPVADGYEATRQIRSNERLKHIAVIALTAHAMTQEKERILAAGFDGYLTKPVSRVALFRELARFIPYSTKEDDEAENTDSRIELPQETLEKLPEIITQLETELAQICESAKTSGYFDDIEDFANKIKCFGEQHSLEILISLGKELLLRVSNLDIDKIEAALNSYPALVEKIKSYQTTD